jgi:UDP:flavonoid glycosyltransferase YjiC (YdhE family)
VRVLFSSTWGYGHVLPMVPLARAFVAAGHSVQWAASGDADGLVTAAGVDAIPAQSRKNN